MKGPGLLTISGPGLSSLLLTYYFFFSNREKKLFGICWTLEIARAIAKAEIKQLRKPVTAMAVDSVIIE